MERLRPPRGLIVDLITPLTSGGDIDGRGLGRLLDRLLPHVQALLLASPYAGEGLNLAPGQRAELLDKALVVVRGSVPVLVWISGDTEERTAENLRLLRKTKEARRYTGPIIWMDTPLLYHSNRGLSPLYERLVSEAGEPFVLHNDPEMIDPLKRAFKRRNIRTSILKELVLTEEGIQGLIFSGSLDRAQNYQKALRSRTGFNIYDGDESNFLVHPSLSGVISKGANLAPRAWQKITASSLRQDDHQDDCPDPEAGPFGHGRHRVTRLHHPSGDPGRQEDRTERADGKVRGLSVDGVQIKWLAYLRTWCPSRTWNCLIFFSVTGENIPMGRYMIFLPCLAAMP
ncbi:MAG: dihydrodipicolinate synthase family protein [Deltaproteobacteria bacterium]|nr:dihydrodipicolinate synthase family protein [Deltaproteobacteria bacterium]